MVRILARAAVAVVLWAVTLSVAHAEATCASLLGVRLDHARVTAAAEDVAGSLPVCKLSVTSKPTPRSDIRMEVWIPKGDAWNGRYLQLGNGGPAGAILTDALRAMALRGYAVANTDMGHRRTDPAWTKDPVLWQDMRGRALKETTVAAKALILAMKGRPAGHAFFAGCSEGGREALVEAQRYPDDFDGIIAAAPANYYGRLITLWAEGQRALLRPGGALSQEDLQLLQRSALADCGGGAWVADPRTCGFDAHRLRCRDAKTATCLTDGQLATVDVLYGGVKLQGDPTVYPGFSPGSEATARNWSFHVADTPEAQRTSFANLSVLSVMPDLAFGGDPVDPAGLSDAQLSVAMHRMSALMDASNPDLRRFRAHGGKLIQWHGWADGLIPARGSILYYEDVSRKMSDVDDFYRLYMVPGLFHCVGGPAPGEADWIQLLDDWVVKGRAPGPITPRDAVGSFIQSLPGAPVCPYPASASGGTSPAGAPVTCLRRQAAPGRG